MDDESVSVSLADALRLAGICYAGGFFVSSPK
jgi:hypothetical protein